MVEELSSGREEVIPERVDKRTTENWEQNKACWQGVRRDLNGMFVESREQLNSRRRLMNLVEYCPEAIPMPKPMPPIEHKRAYKLSYEAFQYRPVPQA